MNRREILRFLAYTGIGMANLGAVISFFSSCSKRHLVHYPLHSDCYGLTILVDGWRADLFKDMLDSGALPNIERHLVDKGTLVETCVSTFPSTTGPAHLPFINGVMPGYNNCPGLRWVDRCKRDLRDYCTMDNVLFNNDFPQSNFTLYEMLHGERTVCIFDFASRGASDMINVPAENLWFMLTGDMNVWHEMDRCAVDAFSKAYLGGGTIPRYSFVWMPAIDHLAHFHGATSTVIIDQALEVDKQVGRLIETLQKCGIYDKTLISLVADHGLSDTRSHIDVREILNKYGLSVLDDLSSTDSYNSLYQHNAARGVSGNSFSLLYFAVRKEGRLGTMRYEWEKHIGYEKLRSFSPDGGDSINLIELLRKEKGINLVLAQESENVVNVFSKTGSARIERDYSSFRYLITGSDPLGYADNPESARLIDGAYHDKDEWFRSTTGTDYPDGIFQIVQLFDSERCGDIVITARPGCDLMDQGHVASHGSMEKAQIQVPCVIAGPGVKQGVIPVARTVDLYPTYLKYFGIPCDDGEVLDVFI